MLRKRSNSPRGLPAVGHRAAPIPAESEIPSICCSGGNHDSGLTVHLKVGSEPWSGGRCQIRTSDLEK